MARIVTIAARFNPSVDNAVEYPNSSSTVSPARIWMLFPKKIQSSPEVLKVRGTVSTNGLSFDPAYLTSTRAVE